MDLEAGYPAYIARRKQKGVQEIDNTLRKSRKLQREVGDLRFVVNDESDDAWRKLVEWKNAQYRESNVVEALNCTWVANTLTALRKTNSGHFSGLLSSLYAGDNLLAVHFGLATETVWHYWFPAYDLTFQKYSAGLILLLKMAEYGAANNIKMIDLGRGQSRYKSAFADNEIELCEGSIERAASLSGALRLVRKAVEPALTALPIGRGRTLSQRLFNRVLWRL
jgi:CelD/BcsL family acetyltransferase involved in cellulose biosynthesis